MLTQPFIDKLLADLVVKIEFDVRHCLRSRLNNNNCSRCLDVCPSDALELHSRQITFNTEKCTSCLRCAAVCPNDAFVHPMDFGLLIQVLAEQEMVLLSCEKGTYNYNHIIIPCIGFLSEPILAVMNSVAKGNCFIDISRCIKCANSYCLETLHQNMQNLIDRTREKGEIRLSYLSGKEPGLVSGEKIEKRRFLRFIRKTIINIVKEAVSFQLPDSGETKDPHRKDQIKNSAALQLALCIMPDKRIYERDVLLSYFFSVIANEQCDCCPSCTGMCSTGALKRKKENGNKFLTFTSANCSGCGLCVDFCRKSALTLKSGFSEDPNNALFIARHPLQT